MNEYSLDFTYTPDGLFTVDIHQPGSSGTSRYRQFASWTEVQEFFLALGLGEKMLEHLHDIGTHLTCGTAYHEQIFLPATFTDWGQERAA
ncbi:MAG: hypothetical protein M3Y57_03730 [Acidobacteriota bacterium]|nr:hypothetical protein [Acidobacteriota bacterium]